MEIFDPMNGVDVLTFHIISARTALISTSISGLNLLGAFLF